MSNTTNSSPVYRTLDTRWITRRTRFQLRILRHHKRAVARRITGIEQQRARAKITQKKRRNTVKEQ